MRQAGARISLTTICNASPRAQLGAPCCCLEVRHTGEPTGKIHVRPCGTDPSFALASGHLPRYQVIRSCLAAELRKGVFLSRLLKSHICEWWMPLRWAPQCPRGAPARCQRSATLRTQCVTFSAQASLSNFLDVTKATYFCSTVWRCF